MEKGTLVAVTAGPFAGKRGEVTGFDEASGRQLVKLEGLHPGILSVALPESVLLVWR